VARGPYCRPRVHHAARTEKEEGDVKTEEIKAEFKKLSVEAARTGWIVRETGKPAEIFIRWDALVSYLASQLLTKD
jgi:hypothetical protein